MEQGQGFGSLQRLASRRRLVPPDRTEKQKTNKLFAGEARWKAAYRLCAMNAPTFVVSNTYRPDIRYSRDQPAYSFQSRIPLVWATDR